MDLPQGRIEMSGCDFGSPGRFPGLWLLPVRTKCLGSCSYCPLLRWSNQGPHARADTVGKGRGGGLALRGEPAPRLSSVAPSLPSVTVDRRQISIVKKLTWPAPRLAISPGLQMNYRFRQETVGGEELTSDLDAKLTNLVW